MAEFRIEELLKQKGMTKKDLANALNVTPSAITQQLNAITKPKYNTLQNIADALGVPTWYLFKDAPEAIDDPIVSIIITHKSGREESFTLTSTL